MLAAEQLTGTMLGETQIERLLGKSQLGAAYTARQPARGRKVLLTIFRFPEGMPEAVRAQFLARFAREGAALLHLVHPHIVPIYEYGEQPGYAYLITAYLKNPSLGQVLKENGRFTPEQALHILQQLAEGLDYLHNQYIMHGMLSLANVIVDGDLHVRIAGLGLHTLLEMHGNARASRPLEHLSSPQGAFLGNPVYISPERVLGLAVDGRADVYALGVMLFELLSGTQPFADGTALDVALQRLQQPAPSLHKARPDLSEAFDLVIGRALERDPAKRYQRAGELVQAFERVIKAGKVAHSAGPSLGSRGTPGMQLTVPPTVNWFDEQISPSGKWQIVPPSGLGPAPARASAPAGPVFSSEEENPASLAGVDPFAWWSSAARGSGPLPSVAGTFARRPQVRPLSPGARGRRQPNQQERRRLVGMIVAGTAAAGVLTVGTISFAHLVGSARRTGLTSSAAATSPVSAGSPTKTQQHTPRPSASPTAQKPKPTPPPKPTAPPHTGKVIGSTALAKNNALRFTNPADGATSLLIHLANGNFVACERACTHEGVPVNYDPASKMLICPAHGAVFDPQNGFNHVSGPGSGPLARVPIQINGDGTITTP